MRKILVSLFLAIFMIGCGEGMPPKQVAESFVKAGYDGNADKMIGLIHFPDGSAANGSKDMIVGKIKSTVEAQKKFAEQFGGVDSITAVSESFEGESLAAVKVEVKFKNDSKTRSDMVRLKKVKDEWKVFF